MATQYKSLPTFFIVLLIAILSGVPRDSVADWAGDCGSGVFDENPNDIWPSFTGCYNPEERFVKKAADANAINAGLDQVCKTDLNGNPVYVDEDGDSIPDLDDDGNPICEMVDVEVAATIPDDNVLRLHDFCIAQFYARLNPATSAFTLQLSDLQHHGPGFAIQCLHNDDLDDFDDFCRHYIPRDADDTDDDDDRDEHAPLPIKDWPYKTHNFRWGEATIITTDEEGEETSETVNCWVREEDRQLGMTGWLNGNDSLSYYITTGIHWLPLRLDVPTGVDETKPRYTDEYGMFRYGEYGGPPGEKKYPFKTDNVYQLPGSTAQTDIDTGTGNVFVPAEVAHERIHMGMKKRNQECLKVYIEEWAHRADCGEIILKGARSNMSEDYCQWVTAYADNESEKLGIRSEAFDHANIGDFGSPGWLPNRVGWKVDPENNNSLTNTSSDVCKLEVLPGTGEALYTRNDSTNEVYGIDFTKRGCPTRTQADVALVPMVLNDCDLEMGYKRILEAGIDLGDLSGATSGKGAPIEPATIGTGSNTVTTGLEPWVDETWPARDCTHGSGHEHRHPPDAVITEAEMLSNPEELALLYDGTVLEHDFHASDDVAVPSINPCHWFEEPAGSGTYINDCHEDLSGDVHGVTPDYNGDPDRIQRGIMISGKSERVLRELSKIEEDDNVTENIEGFLGGGVLRWWYNSAAVPPRIAQSRINSKLQRDPRLERRDDRFNTYESDDLTKQIRFFAWRKTPPAITNVEWCEFQVPFDPFDHSGISKNTPQYRTRIEKHDFINSPITSDRMNLKLKMVERIRDGCNAFNIRRNWEDDVGALTNFSLWLTGKASGRLCDNSAGMYGKHYETVSFSGWRLPRFNYEFLKSFLQCTGPIIELAPQQERTNPCDKDDAYSPNFPDKGAFYKGIWRENVLSSERGIYDIILDEHQKKINYPDSEDSKKLSFYRFAAEDIDELHEWQGERGHSGDPTSGVCSDYKNTHHFKKGWHTRCSCEERCRTQWSTPEITSGMNESDVLKLIYEGHCCDPNLCSPINGKVRIPSSECGDDITYEVVVDASTDFPKPTRLPEYGFWCSCPEDDLKTVNCNENYCTCNQRVTTPGVASREADLDEGLPAIEGRASKAVCSSPGPFKRWLECFYSAKAKACPVATRDISAGIPPSTTVQKFSPTPLDIGECYAPVRMTGPEFDDAPEVPPIPDLTPIPSGQVIFPPASGSDDWYITECTGDACDTEPSRGRLDIALCATETQEAIDKWGASGPRTLIKEPACYDKRGTMVTFFEAPNEGSYRVTANLGVKYAAGVRPNTVSLSIDGSLVGEYGFGGPNRGRGGYCSGKPCPDSSGKFVGCDVGDSGHYMSIIGDKKVDQVVHLDAGFHTLEFSMQTSTPGGVVVSRYFRGCREPRRKWEVKYSNLPFNGITAGTHYLHNYGWILNVKIATEGEIIPIPEPPEPPRGPSGPPLRWAGEEPNILARLPVSPVDGNNSDPAAIDEGGGYRKHHELIFQGAVKDTAPPYLEPMIPDPRQNVGATAPADVKNNANRKYDEGLLAASAAWKDPTARKHEGIVGPRGCDIGGWYEMMLYQARCIKWFRLNCLCDYKKTFIEGSAESYVLKRGGMVFETVKPVIRKEEGEVRDLALRPEPRVFPLMWRGFAGKRYAPNDDDPDDLLNPGKKVTDPNERIAFLKGLDSAAPGDFVIWDETIKDEEGEDAGYRRHIAYVDDTKRGVSPSNEYVKYLTDRGKDLQKVLVADQEREVDDGIAYRCELQIDFDGDSVPDNAYHCGTNEVTVREWNWGKHQDSCGNTDRWKIETTRYIYYSKRDVTDLHPQLPADLAVCKDPDWKYCHEPNWTRLKIYRVSNDLRARENWADSDVPEKNPRYPECEDKYSPLHPDDDLKGQPKPGPYNGNAFPQKITTVSLIPLMQDILDVTGAPGSGEYDQHFGTESARMASLERARAVVANANTPTALRNAANNPASPIHKHWTLNGSAIGRYDFYEVEKFFKDNYGRCDPPEEYRKEPVDIGSRGKLYFRKPAIEPALRIREGNTLTMGPWFSGEQREGGNCKSGTCPKVDTTELDNPEWREISPGNAEMNKVCSGSNCESPAIGENRSYRPGEVPEPIGEFSCSDSYLDSGCCQDAVDSGDTEEIENCKLNFPYYCPDPEGVTEIDDTTKPNFCGIRSMNVNDGKWYCIRFNPPPPGC